MVWMAQNSNRNTETEYPALGLLLLEQPKKDEIENELKTAKRRIIKL